MPFVCKGVRGFRKRKIKGKKCRFVGKGRKRRRKYKRGRSYKLDRAKKSKESWEVRYRRRKRR